MSQRLAVVDTNVVVAGLLTNDADAPTARILDGMLAGRFPFVLSVDLLAEYREVLLRERIRARHGLQEEEVDELLAAIVLNAIVREPTRAAAAPDEGDQHVWDLLGAHASTVLVTGDRRLLDSAPADVSVVSPAAFVKLSLAGSG